MSEDSDKPAGLDAIHAAREVGQAMIAEGRKAITIGQRLVDLSQVAEQAMNAANTPLDPETKEFLANAFKPIVKTAKTHFYGKVQHSIDAMGIVVHSACTATGTTVISSNLAGTLARLFGGSDDLPHVKRLMVELELHTPSGDRLSPLEQLESAERTFSCPPADDGNGAGSLIPLRECIDQAIACLLRRRPKQEPAGGPRKLASIAEQCGRDGVTYPDQLAETYRRVVDQLSGAKARRMSREQIGVHFNQGLSLLRDILEMVDPAKLRPIE